MIDPTALLARYPANLPRYTSYPTAPHFSEAGTAQLSKKLIEAFTNADDVSIYIHIPFCDRLCWFCGCHTKQTLKYGPVQSYIGYVEREIALVRERVPLRPRIAHLHLGGGSPSMVQQSDFERLRQALETLVEFDEQTEVSVEIDPSDQTLDLLSGLTALGVTRASIGVQDFDPDVQVAINRIQTFEQTERTIKALRDLGIRSINIDALYGLPYQTEERLMATLDKVVQLSPDRIALFGYAHVPWMKKHQSMIPDAALPGDSDRVRQAFGASDRLVEAGYIRIGLDHFAKQSDSMCAALRDGRLHRNFQGYTTDESEVMLGIGASSISRFPGGLVQNIVATANYQQRVLEGQLPHGKGIAFSRDDQIRGWIIERLMCDLKFSKQELVAEMGDEGDSYWQITQDVAGQLPRELCTIDGDVFTVPEQARNYIRIVASQFDAYLASGTQKYSKAV